MSVDKSDIPPKQRKIEKKIAQRDGLLHPDAGVPEIHAIRKIFGFGPEDLNNRPFIGIQATSGKKIPKSPDSDGRSPDLGDFEYR